MKRILLSIVSIVAAVAAVAQPKLVGHRGSYWGVENTSEAFINGAKKGYNYLETDVKVTSDGTFVCCHNDDLTSWGGTLTIASSTWASLSAETLTQTRGGVTYTGHLTSLEEYLDICKEYGVLPLIELKWATGVNSNDCSNIPALVKLIEDKGFRNSCYIFTSMKPCLQYIHDNYPDIQLMLLAYSSSFESSLSWCVERGINMGVGIGSEITKEGVKRYHDAGLLVNAWSINTTAVYETYGNYGCDFITTDYLDPSALPELDPDVLFPPNTVDYPELDAPVRGNYNPMPVSTATMPEHLKGLNVRRALMRDGKWYVLALGSDNTPVLSVVDAETAEELKRMDITGVAGGIITLNDIAFSADGVLLGCNLSGDTWKIYRWNDDTAAAQELMSCAVADIDLGNPCALGESFAVSGNMNDLYIYTTAKVDAVDEYRFVGMKTSNGALSAVTYATDAVNYTSNAWGDGFSIMVTPFSRNNLLIDSPTMLPVQYSFDWEKRGEPMALHSQWKEGVIEAAATGHSFLRIANKVYSFSANFDASMSGVRVGVYNVTDGIDNCKAISPAMPEVPENGTLSYVTTGIEYTADGDMVLYVFAIDEGLAKYVVKGNKLVPSPSAEFVLEPVWENSRVKGNAPSHIDGTNAQQGAAHNGIFYVNDCVDSTLYLFDSTGCLGGLPGGGGWGTACDDAGNIIVRDDKATDGNHSFIVYPSGTTIENQGSPIAFNVTIPLTGQTNFISASGDVLGLGGYIYMFPNKQEQINIIAVAGGEVVEVETSDYISLTGSAAGYVIPIDNNTEDWVYNVRASGLYRYQGGENTALLSGRGSTTAPARNTTGGGDYFTLSGHEILVYPSGANYRGGFSIKDLTVDSVLTSVDPIGDLGYVTGGNYSTFNWLFAEKIDDNSYYIYLYCPANGMAVYRFYDRNAVGVEPIVAESLPSLRLYPNPADDVLEIDATVEIDEVAIYNVSGQIVWHGSGEMSGRRTTIDVGSLAAGIYVLKVNNQAIVGKFIKK